MDLTVIRKDLTAVLEILSRRVDDPANLRAASFDAATDASRAVELLIRRIDATPTPRSVPELRGVMGVLDEMAEYRRAHPSEA